MRLVISKASRQRFFAVAAASLAIACGEMAELKYSLWVPSLCCVGMVLSTLLLMKSFNVEYGSPQCTWVQIVIDSFLSGCVIIIASVPFIPAWGPSHAVQLFLGLLAYFFTAFVCNMYFRQGFCFVLGVVLLFAATSNYRVANIPACCSFIYLAPFCFLATRTRYHNDQRFMVAVATICANLIKVGSTIAEDSIVEGIVYLLICLFFAYVCYVFRRRTSRTTGGLQGVRFVSLAYFRKLLKQEGGRIRRCQDLPPEAFCDPNKAEYVIVISHRWLDPFTCDVAIEQYPHGIRLHTMVDKLNRYFSFGNNALYRRSWRDSVHRALTGGSDVGIFFDFCSLPQEGVGPDGMFEARTREEDVLFRRCLPNMGTLYSMFPVIICDEVDPCSSSYLDSGWCFLEFVISSIGGTLRNLPKSIADPKVGEIVSFQQFHSASGHFLDLQIQEFQELFRKDLATKNFRFLTDKLAVCSIVDLYFRKRCLCDAIKDKDEDRMRSILAGMDSESLHTLLDQPVDAYLNTLLHLAVSCGFRGGVNLLLANGANWKLRNIRGDNFRQLFMLPRVTMAYPTKTEFQAISLRCTPSSTPRNQGWA